MKKNVPCKTSMPFYHTREEMNARQVTRREIVRGLISSCHLAALLLGFLLVRYWVSGKKTRVSVALIIGLIFSLFFVKLYVHHFFGWSYVDKIESGLMLPMGMTLAKIFISL